ncbi:hypothetical protein BOTNAR_0546g00010 [Botryotinia narcissicola]|uniref:Uncharacterized protein n=1 Tax=Botryotinia narcissicola TaxID=278944 RepID=A0A4Z1HDH2_9HELO|nr:hypothetical protein BOTNAR_0546g00010 [Botryotinia narcissicola]
MNVIAYKKGPPASTTKNRSTNAMSHHQRRKHHSSRRRESERREARDRWSHADPNHPVELGEIRREQCHTPRRRENHVNDGVRGKLPSKAVERNFLRKSSANDQRHLIPQNVQMIETQEWLGNFQ